jgi:DNA polymerase-3 subunit delta'
MSDPPAVEDAWDLLAGQPRAAAQLRAAVKSPVHAYLFVGRQGAGARDAVRVFSGELLATTASSTEEATRHRRLALMERHPDLRMIEPEGAVFRGRKESGGEDDESEGMRFLREASRSPMEGSRKVVVATDFHRANAAAVGMLLKTVEEPPESTVVIIVADDVPPEQTTIASRCLRIDFPPLSEGAVAAALTEAGVEPDRAAEVATLAGGDLTRARLLAADERLALRTALWRDVPRRLDGTGTTVATLVDELRATIDDAQAPLTARHEEEVAAAGAEQERYGQTGSPAKRLESRHRREVRSLRTDELRLGLATLARTYRQDAAVAARPGPALASLSALAAAADELRFNPTEELWLRAVLLRLAPLVA